jgi:hypothetical protein
VDHLEPFTERPELAFSLANCRPAHGAPGNRCPVCHQNCNQLKSGMSLARARRIIAERVAEGKGKPERVKPDPSAGREW